MGAQVYRTELAEAGVFLWDTFWFGGHYPLAEYSLLYHPLAALVGNAPLAIASTAASAGLFGSIALRRWGRGGRTLRARRASRRRCGRADGPAPPRWSRS